MRLQEEDARNSMPECRAVAHARVSRCGVRKGLHLMLGAIRRQLHADSAACLAGRGAGEIKLHPWFHGLDWTTLARTKAAFVPSVDDELDTSYFHPKSVRRALFTVRVQRRACGKGCPTWLLSPAGGF